jgi:hypothetical protein
MRDFSSWAAALLDIDFCNCTVICAISHRFGWLKAVFKAVLCHNILATIDPLIERGNAHHAKLDPLRPNVRIRSTGLRRCKTYVHMRSAIITACLSRCGGLCSWFLALAALGTSGSPAHQKVAAPRANQGLTQWFAGVGTRRLVGTLGTVPCRQNGRAPTFLVFAYFLLWPEDYELRIRGC